MNRACSRPSFSFPRMTSGAQNVRTSGSPPAVWTLPSGCIRTASGVRLSPRLPVMAFSISDNAQSSFSSNVSLCTAAASVSIVRPPPADKCFCQLKKARIM